MAAFLYRRQGSFPPAIEETRAFPFSLSFCEKGGGRETENVLKRDSQGEGAGNGNLRRRGVARLPGCEGRPPGFFRGAFYPLLPGLRPGLFPPAGNFVLVPRAKAM